MGENLEQNAMKRRRNKYFWHKKTPKPLRVKKMDINREANFWKGTPWAQALSMPGKARGF